MHSLSLLSQRIHSFQQLFVSVEAGSVLLLLELDGEVMAKQTPASVTVTQTREAKQPRLCLEQMKLMKRRGRKE